ncbi:MAG: amidohydrolase family protein [Pseudomonadota bacterium]
MIIDAHIHCSGEEVDSDILRQLDVAGIDKAVLLAPFLSPGYSLHDASSLQRANAYLAALVRRASDRLIGFAVINPLDENACSDFERAVEQGLRGLKMVPTGWYPYDDYACRVYEVAERLNIPILFHSGIFIDGRSGRFCRPAFYEAIRDFPKLRVTLAHLGWPWTDEANAVGLIDLINGVPPDECQFRFDISFGAPPIYRLEVFRKALAVLSPALLQFGSDRFLPCSGAHIKEKMDEVAMLFDQLDVTPEDRARMMGGTAAAWLGI